MRATWWSSIPRAPWRPRSTAAVPTVSPCRSTSRRNCPPGCGPSRSAGMDAPCWKPPPGPPSPSAAADRCLSLTLARPLRRRRPTLGRRHRDTRGTPRLPGPARAAYPLRLRPGGVPDLDLSERLRHGTGLGRDAERRTTIHSRGVDAPGGQGSGRGPVAPAHRRGLARGERTALCRVLQGVLVDLASHQRRSPQRWPRHCHRHHGGAAPSNR